ncbi:4-hydroxybenzoate 3-monooxygenase [Virgisporangium aliadipatigenens]|uniref:4-hydroxybenzoate 3-monooxygenase n=1 Tax=Virgisporangium aliadipatigenens TaxID=741659 RepID=A0A8J3YT39_9ACTN|nr:4-hydroxybenzoate 3-monooxygenase [Virgisporangium aliadipatigenens]GIJ49440.1 4-hydroxybenzoate 3-monooxygenase [Virgisporangium aliadipatigenens]
MRTRVGIVGAGPAGLMLAHLLRLAGIDSVVLERRSREYVEKRVRAGVLEHPTVELLRETGAGERLDREGLPHHGFALRFDGVDHRVDLSGLTGHPITVYGQQEVVKDLIALRLAAGEPLLFDVSDVALHDLTTDAPRITWRGADGTAQELTCDVVAGCDGFHGVARQSIPQSVLTIFERAYPFAWLGVLARTAPSADELIYTYHERGFALHSMRSPEITRLYLQVPPEEDIADWSDARIWDELSARLATRDGFTLTSGPILDKGVTPMRSFVAEPLRHGRLFLAGDAAHIVPPTGAKGMNLAIADVRLLARAVEEFVRNKDERLLDSYSADCLKRVWRAEHFSWWMTSMLHLAPDADPFDRRLQLAQLRYTAASDPARTSLAENYVGLAYERL